MITSPQDLTELARNHPQLAGMLADGDWYLVGSRAAAAGDDLSDWDTVVFTRGRCRRRPQRLGHRGVHSRGWRRRGAG